MADEQGPWSKYGSQPAEVDGPWSKYAQTPAEPPPASAGSRFASGLMSGASEANPLAGIGNAIMHPIDTAKGLISSQVGEFGKAKQAFQDTQGMPNLSDRLMSAGGHLAAGLLPIAGPAAANIGEQTGSQAGQGDVAGALGKGLGYVGTTAALPKIAEETGGMIRKPAPAIAETALGVRNVDRAFHRNPGEAILNETSGVRPATIQKSAQGRIGGLNQQLESAVDASKNQVDLSPAKQVLTEATGKAIKQNSLATVNELNPMTNHLERNQFTGQQFGNSVTPRQALDLKRGFGNDYVNFKPERGEAANEAGKSTYGALAKGIEAAVPEAGPLNSRMSNLIPVANRAAAKSLAPTPLQGMMGRIARPTGALAGALSGAYEGARHGGIPGALVGGALGLGIPEMVSSPTVQMVAARSLNNAGKAVASPVTGTVSRVGSLLNANRQQRKQ